MSYWYLPRDSRKSLEAGNKEVEQHVVEAGLGEEQKKARARSKKGA